MQSYQLILDISQPITVQVGRLGKFKFDMGKYVYTGSAKKNMEARIKRQLAKTKLLRWHIDALTSHASVKIVEVLRTTRSECELNQSVTGSIICKGFGSSDCRSGCQSHLKGIS